MGYFHSAVTGAFGGSLANHILLISVLLMLTGVLRSYLHTFSLQRQQIKNPHMFFPVSSCITTYKKTPPPVPPRTTTKPFISITAQSSTESAQDAYMDGHGQRGDIISQSGLSNSTESLDSMKALTAAIEAANAQIHGPASQHVGNNTATVTTTTTIATVAVEDRKKDHFKKNRCLSIGIQVWYTTWIICAPLFGVSTLVLLLVIQCFVCFSCFPDRCLCRISSSLIMPHGTNDVLLIYHKNIRRKDLFKSPCRLLFSSVKLHT